MIWEAVSDADFAATVQARAIHLAAGPTTAYRLAKQALRRGLDNRIDEQFGLEGAAPGRGRPEPRLLRGVMAFLGKRPVRNQGH
jgi:2-(1,2-epoxy-1,2-dihydrophenyl)acetyl-CoA isomerase